MNVSLNSLVLSDLFQAQAISTNPGSAGDPFALNSPQNSMAGAAGGVTGAPAGAMALALPTPGGASTGFLAGNAGWGADSGGFQQALRQADARQELRRPDSGLRSTPRKADRPAAQTKPDKKDSAAPSSEGESSTSDTTAAPQGDAGAQPAAGDSLHAPGADPSANPPKMQKGDAAAPADKGQDKASPEAQSPNPISAGQAAQPAVLAAAAAVQTAPGKTSAGAASPVDGSTTSGSTGQGPTASQATSGEEQAGASAAKGSSRGHEVGGTQGQAQALATGGDPPGGSAGGPSAAPAGALHDGKGQGQGQMPSQTSTPDNSGNPQAAANASAAVSSPGVTPAANPVIAAAVAAQNAPTAAASGGPDAKTRPPAIGPSPGGPATANPLEGSLSALGTGPASSSTGGPTARADAAGGTPQPAAAPTTTDVNVARIARGLQTALAQRGGTLSLRLTPQDMGTVRIDLSVQNGVVSASLTAEHEAVRNLLGQDLGQLKSALESRGLTVGRLEVQTQAPPAQAPSGPTPQQNYAGGDGRSRGQFTQQGFSQSSGQQGGSPRDGRRPDSFQDQLLNMVA